MAEYNPFINITISTDDLDAYHAKHGITEVFKGWNVFHEIVHCAYQLGFTRYDELCVEIIHAFCIGLTADQVLVYDRVQGALKHTAVNATQAISVISSCEQLWCMYQVAVVFPKSNQAFNLNMLLRSETLMEKYATENDELFTGN